MNQEFNPHTFYFPKFHCSQKNMATSARISLAIWFCLCVFILNLCANAIEVSHDGRAITIDGERRVLLSGSIHYPRSTPGVLLRTNLCFLLYTMDNII